MTAVHRDRLSIVLGNELAEVGRVAERVETFCDERDVPPRVARRFNLALDEVLSNVISHAFPDGRRHEIEVQIDLRDGRLAATVRDDGKPFDPLSLPPPDIHAPIEERKVGGLGIHLMRSLAHSVEYRRAGGRNRLTFTMLLDTPERREAGR
jgi:serine/threonine-protein kinase RsbW/sigma-B regulation protein RsbU (phosphoserine phosphatase)